MLPSSLLSEAVGGSDAGLSRYYETPFLLPAPWGNGGVEELYPKLVLEHRHISHSNKGTLASIREPGHVLPSSRSV